MHYPVNHFPARNASRDLLSQLTGRAFEGWRFNTVEVLVFYAATLTLSLVSPGVEDPCCMGMHEVGHVAVAEVAVGCSVPPCSPCTWFAIQDLRYGLLSRLLAWGGLPTTACRLPPVCLCSGVPSHAALRCAVLCDQHVWFTCDQHV